MKKKTQKKTHFFLTFIFTTVFIVSCSKGDSNNVTKVQFDGYEVAELVNAKAKVKDNKLVIEKIDNSKADFKFSLRPLTPQYWINVYFSNLLLSDNMKIQTETFIKDGKEVKMDSRITITNKQFSVYSPAFANLKSYNLLGYKAGGDWAKPDYKDTLVNPQIQGFFWVPWVVGGVIYVLDKYDYKRVTKYDKEGKVISSESTHSWGGDGGDGLITAPNGKEIGQGKWSYELTYDQPTRSEVVPPIDGSSITCTGFPKIVIPKILNKNGDL